MLRRKANRKAKRKQRAGALGLAHGLSQIEAVKQAGYRDSTAEKKAYQIVQRPQVQSMLTDALEALGVTAKQIMQPIKEGLEACEVVQTKDGKMLTDYPDHKTRLMAHVRAVSLYGLTGKHTDRVEAELAPVAPIKVNIVFVDPKKRDPQPNMQDVRFVPHGPR